MSANNLQTLSTQLIAQAKADPKKASILVVLLAVMGVMWVRLMGGGSTGPAKAAASPVTGARSGAEVVTESPKIAPRPVNGSTLTLAAWAERPIAALSRNLFVINYDFFPQDGSKFNTLRTPQGDGFWDQLAKSMTSRADQKKEKDVLVENLRLRAAQLKVQSIVMSASPKALINGDLVKEGDVVASFRVLKIEARRIVLECEGIKLEVRFN